MWNRHSISIRILLSSEVEVASSSSLSLFLSRHPSFFFLSEISLLLFNLFLCKIFLKSGQIIHYPFPFEYCFHQKLKYLRLLLRLSFSIRDLSTFYLSPPCRSTFFFHLGTQLFSFYQKSDYFLPLQRKSEILRVYAQTLRFSRSG